MRLVDEGVVITSRELEFERRGVFNPTCLFENGQVRMWYRAVGENGISQVGYAGLSGVETLERKDSPILFPSAEYENRGTEDPRVTKLGEDYFLVYVALDDQANARLALARSVDGFDWTKYGLIGPNVTYSEAVKLLDRKAANKGYKKFIDFFIQAGSKDSFLYGKSGGLFPKKLGGKVVMVHRIHPAIQVAYADDWSEFKRDSYWRDYLANLGNFTVMYPELDWEGEVIGMGSVPIETSDGWLVVYYGSEKKGEERMFRVGVALWDIESPGKIVRRLRSPLFEPKADWEKTGNVPNVVFPSGAVVVGDRLWIYYGAGDKVVGAKSVDLKDLLFELKNA